jgi:transcriptional antiterminator NusG
MSIGRNRVTHESPNESCRGKQVINSAAEPVRLDSRWFALWTRSRQEKVAASMLRGAGVQHFLPLKSELRQWSDRKKVVERPLFSGYLFVRMNLSRDNRLQVLKSSGIVGFVGNSSGPAPIPDHQIEQIRTVISEGLECSESPLLEEGDLVRVVRGPLIGLQGRLIQKNSSSRLLISIESINRAVAISVVQEDVEPVEDGTA